MVCGGHGFLNDDTYYQNSELSSNNKTIAHILCPENIYDWLWILVSSVVSISHKNRKRIPRFIFLIGQLKNEGDLMAITCRSSDDIIVTMTPKTFGRFKKLKPQSNINSIFSELTETLWHEMWHYKFKKGTKYPTDSELDKVHSDFLKTFNLEYGDEK
ncbi:hypothetical protein KAU43_07475 [candidate division WOR-3 bacterium]|nr:hypothetical protein [candidate division WOR-3 bacterium]